MFDDSDKLPTHCPECGKKVAKEDLIVCWNCGATRCRDCWNEHSSSEFVQDGQRCPGCFNIMMELEGTAPPDDD